MRYFTLLFISLLLLAEDKRGVDIDKEIEKIIQSPPSQRHRMMNHLKQLLFHLHQQKRIEVIEHLKETLSQQKHQQKQHKKGSK